MIELLARFDDRIVAIAADGQVKREDDERVLIPRVNALLQRRRRIRIYYELGAAFAGIEPAAACEDFNLGVGHLTRWERMAAVTDVRWIRVALEAFGLHMPGTVRVLDSAHAAEAHQWIEADLA